MAAKVGPEEAPDFSAKVEQVAKVEPAEMPESWLHRAPAVTAETPARAERVAKVEPAEA
jgi:hypothetical protein